MIKKTISHLILKLETPIHQQLLFALVGAVFFLIPHFIFSTKEQEIITSTRIVVGWSCCILILLIQAYSLEIVKRGVVVFYWGIVLTLTLPTFSIFMLLIKNYDQTWVLYLILSTSILALITHYATFALIMSFGVLTALIRWLVSSPAEYNIRPLLFLCICAGVLNGIMIIHFKYRGYRLLHSCKRKLSSIRAEVQSDLMQKIDVINKALESQNRFLNNLSHEMRSPVQGISAISEEMIAKWHNACDTEKLECMELISKSSARLITLISDLLDTNKYSAGYMSLDLIECDMQDLIDSVVHDLMLLSLTRKIPVYFHRDINAKIKVIVDPVKIKQVLSNLISNALKYTNSGRVDVMITNHDVNTLKVRVKDTGVGIPPDELKSIFLPFFRGSMTAKKQIGTGLGLAISGEIIRLHAGSIWAENNLDIGASVYFTMPIKPKNESEPHDYKAFQDQAIQTLRSKGTVLIIDDDFACAKSIALLFDSLNIQNKIVNNYEQLLRNMQDMQVSLIISDVLMNDINGLELLREIKCLQQYKDIPIVLVSGLTTAEEIHLIKELGGMYLSKPYRKQEMIDIITRIYAQ